MTTVPNSDLAPGSSEFVFVDPRPGPRREVTVFAHRPRRWTPDAHVLLVMHGRARDGAAYREGWIAQAEERGFLLAVPQFSEAFYPGSYDYNYGDMMTREEYYKVIGYHDYERRLDGQSGKPGNK